MDVIMNKHSNFWIWCAFCDQRLTHILEIHIIKTFWKFELDIHAIINIYYAFFKQYFAIIAYSTTLVRNVPLEVL